MTAPIRTKRIELIPATIALSEAEMHDREAFARLLSADIPASWPPESLADALPFFLQMLRDTPEWFGWLSWYGVLADVARRRLVGSIGFKGGPDDDGMVEIGYSVVPEEQGNGIATEMTDALTKWALRHARVTRVEAETVEANRASQRVLEKIGFRRVAVIDGMVRWVRER